MYEAVTAYPTGRATVSRLARVAASIGFDGIVVRNWDEVTETGASEGAEEDTDVDVVRAVTVDASDRSRARSAIDRLREEYPILLARTDGASATRYAAERRRIDVVTGVVRDGQAPAHTTVRTARDNGVRIEVSLEPVLRSRGGRRVRHVQALEELARVIEHYDAPYVVSAAPSSHLELRGPRGLVAVGTAIGLDAEWLERGLEEWRRLADRGRRVQSESFIEPGVERSDGDTEGRST